MYKAKALMALALRMEQFQSLEDGDVFTWGTCMGNMTMETRSPGTREEEATQTKGSLSAYHRALSHVPFALSISLSHPSSLLFDSLFWKN